MRLARLEDRIHVVGVDGGYDLAAASGGRFSADPISVLAQLAEVQDWAATANPALDPALSTGALANDPSRLQAPVDRPSQIFAVGLNYQSHADESELAVPDQPMVFTKFASSLAGPADSVPVAGSEVDWEVELVAVVGKSGREIAEADAYEHIAGFCVGQDVSDRSLQMANTPPQFSLGKSHANFAPTGPWITTLDELDDPTDLAIECRLGGESVQRSRTSAMLFPVPELVAYLSSICELRVGDLIFTGTPEGVGFSRTPPRFLTPGTELISIIEGLGELRNRCVAP